MNKPTIFDMYEAAAVPEHNDTYPGGWFGESWHSPVCTENRHKDTPVGEECGHCGKPIQEDDQGHLLPLAGPGPFRLLPYHHECLMENILGPGWKEKFNA